MNEILLQFTSQAVIPALGALLMAVITIAIPILTQALNKWLKEKFKLEQDLVQRNQEQWVLDKAQVWVDYAEELARKELKEKGLQLTSSQKLAIATDKLYEDTPDKVTKAKAEEAILKVLPQTRQ